LALLIGGLQKLLQGVELSFPKLLIVVDPGSSVLQRSWCEPAPVEASVNFASQQTAGFQNAQVLGNRRKRHLEGCCERFDSSFAGTEASQDSAPRGIGECGERGIQRSLGIVNHTVYYR